MGRDRPQKKKKELCVWLKKKHPPPICCVSSSILQFFEDGGGWGSKNFFFGLHPNAKHSHTSLPKFSLFPQKKKTCERKTDEQIYTHAAADIYDDGEIRRVVVIAIAIVERILENESRAASSARTIHATSGGASESFWGDEFYTRGRQKKKQ